MNSLEDVPFQTPLGSLGESLGELELVRAPHYTIPDCHQILRDTKYDFVLENWVLTGFERGSQRVARPVTPTQRCENPPSCPPYWLMFSSPQESRWASRTRSDLWLPSPRPRSHSMTSADSRRLHHRTVKFRGSGLEDEAGYSEDDEGSSTDDASRPSKCRERPRSAAPKDPLSRVRELHLGPSTPTCKSVPHQASTRPSSASSGRRTPVVEQSQTSPQRPRGKHTNKKQCSLGHINNKHAASTQTARFSPFRHQQTRPSSAGPAVQNRRQKTLRTTSSHGVFVDYSAELMSALSQDEQELLDAVTDQGYPLRTAILALQKTGYRSPEKLLHYLRATSHLCELGYDEAQVEEALEMFQNCENKAAEFLHLLTQFNEMGFQQSAIKEVLLVHENHREKALEELMTRTA